jgi:hypothetical protein
MDRAPKRDDLLHEREEEATEKKTLKDLEESFGSSDTNESDEGEVPSPDGSFDEEDELDPADPM